MSVRRSVGLSVVALTLLVCLAGAAWSVDYISDHKATFRTPSVVNLEKTDRADITVYVTTPDGKPYTGPVDVWSTSAAFVGDNGRPVTSPIRVNAINGQARVIVSFSQIGCSPVSSCRVDATMNMHLCGSAEFKLRRAATLDLRTPDPVKVNAAPSPVTVAVIRDQDGLPLPDVPVQVWCKTPRAKQVRKQYRTDARGEVRVTFPPSKVAGEGCFQVITAHDGSPQMKLVYTETGPATP